jgi:methylated-DNA-[protein]-cysteine S-methyltransferase
METIMNGNVWLGTVDTSLGQFGAAMTEKGLCCLMFPREGTRACKVWLRRHLPGARIELANEQLGRVAEELNGYLTGEVQDFSLPLDLRGTPFQLAVWQAVANIPYGTTRSYGEIARLVGQPSEARAVGAANGSNPVPIVVPCHRVIGSNGGLTGYGGGIDLKWRLLELEGVVLPAFSPTPPNPVPGSEPRA